jgi:hypothetical protein
MAPEGDRIKRFLSPGEYEHGRVAGVWAFVYLGVTALLILGAVPESSSDADAGGDVTSGLASVLTLPLSLGALTGQDRAWMLVGLAACALVNAFVLWVVFRGTAHYRRCDRTIEVPVPARPNRRASKRRSRKELGDSLHPRKPVGDKFGTHHGRMR